MRQEKEAESLEKRVERGKWKRDETKNVIRYTCNGNDAYLCLCLCTVSIKLCFLTSVGAPFKFIH